MNRFTTKQAHLLEEKSGEKRWLINDLWTDEAVGIIGGEPKCCKSFLALSLAVSVASGHPCLNRYKVSKKGRVLLFAAEDALHVVKNRLSGIASALNLSLQDLDIHVITEPLLRLDLKEDQQKLRQTIKELKPKLLILDPFVRLHRIDENVSGEVAPVLATLRELQRVFQVAIMIVHHSRKGAGKQRAGQALRGSSEFHAWGDANLYLRRDKNEQLNLSVEHRSEASKSGIPLELYVNGPHFSLRITEKQEEAMPLSPTEKIEDIFKNSQQPISMSEIRSQLKIRAQTASELVNQLVQTGALTKTKEGFKSATL
jgi:RecA-family ATPase